MAEHGTVLIQCGDHWENQQRILPLASGLSQRGWHPVVMTYARHQGVLFLRHGIDVAPLDARRRSMAQLGANALGMSAGLHHVYRGVDVTDVARVERRREPKRFATPLSRAAWRFRLARRIDSLTDLLSETRPARVFIWNGLTGVVALSLGQLCRQRKIPQAFVERGLPPESVFLDPEGTNGSSQLHRLALEELPEAECVRGLRGLPEIASQPNELRRRHSLNAARLVFVPLQVERDTNILFHSDEVRSMRQLVESVSDAVRGQDAVVVVRRHPEEIETRLGLPRRDNIRYIDEGPVEAWCDAADLIVTVNSTVGLTALLRCRPVVALGRAIYTNKGLCREPRLGELAAALRDASTYVPADRGRVETFYRVLLDRHTATADHVPDLVPRADGAATPAGGPFNPYGIDPQRFYALWQKALEGAKAAARLHGGARLVAQLRDGDRVALTYRRREPVRLDRLRDGVAMLLGSRTVGDGRRGGPSVVVTPQTRDPNIDADTVLVLDQYLEPHAAWLIESFRG